MRSQSDSREQQDRRSQAESAGFTNKNMCTLCITMSSIPCSRSVVISVPLRQQRRHLERIQCVTRLPEGFNSTIPRNALRKKRQWRRHANENTLERNASIVASLLKDNLVSETCAAHLENITSGVPLEVLKRMQRNNSEKLRREACHPELVKFALTLLFYSTEAYEYVRKHFNLALPYVATIRRWYSAIDGNPGFTQEAILIP